jgi:hypothetical protein
VNISPEKDSRDHLGQLLSQLEVNKEQAAALTLEPPRGLAACSGSAAILSPASDALCSPSTSDTERPEPGKGKGLHLGQL